MIKVSRSHFKNVCMQVLAVEAYLGLSNGRLKQTGISYTVTPPVGIDLILMRFKEVIQSQEYHWRLLRKFLERFIDLGSRGVNP
jgi:hypothetical protein